MASLYESNEWLKHSMSLINSVACNEQLSSQEY